MGLKWADLSFFIAIIILISFFPGLNLEVSLVKFYMYLEHVLMVAAGTTGGDFRRFTRRNSSAEALESAEPRSPTVYDWFSLFFVCCLYN